MDARSSLEPQAWVERFNALGENLDAGGAALVSLEPEILVRAAREATGLSDFGAESLQEPLEVLCRALREEAELTLLGRVIIRAELQRLLQNRLRIQARLAAQPTILERAIEAPVFVTGLGRSGTTLLHELLWQDPANRVPLLYELLYPLAPPGAEPGSPDPRVAASQREITLMDEIIPAFTAMHENGGDLPNECIFIFAHLFQSDVWLGEYRIPSYAAWKMRADGRALYRWHRRFLQLLQADDAREHWVLKAPSHLSSLPELFSVYPDAHVVVTHRDPLRVLGSLSNLMATLMSMRSAKVDRAACVRMQAAGFPFLVERHMHQRAQGLVPENQITDLRYTDLVADPVGTLAGLYARLGRRFSAEARQRLERRVATQPAEARGRHRYRFEETGLDLETERARYATYMNHFKVPEEV